MPREEKQHKEKKHEKQKKRKPWRRSAVQGDALVLIGMPGCGKSTLGRHLARRYRKPFIDVDDVLMAQENKSIRKLALEHSYHEFVRLEEKAACSIKTEQSVIATGGSVVYSPRSMDHLQRLGTVVYLCKPFQETRRRAGNPKRRGIVIPPGETYDTYQEERHRLYRRYADIIFMTKDKSVQESLMYLTGLLEFIDPENFKPIYF